MRISDWSSDVCSSDLRPAAGRRRRRRRRKPRRAKSHRTADLYPSRATCPGSTEGRTGQREPFPRCCIRSVTQELSMPDHATTEAVAWSTLPDAELVALARRGQRSEEHTSELQSLMRISYAVFCLKNKKPNSCTEQNTC